MVCLEFLAYLVSLNICLFTALGSGRILKGRLKKQVLKLLLSASAIFLIVLSLTSPAQATVITEYNLIGDVRPLSIVAAADGNAYFTEQLTGNISRITSTGLMTRWDVKMGAVPNPEPYGIAIDPTETDPQGPSYVWFTNVQNNSIGRLGVRLSTGQVLKWSLAPGSNPRHIAYDQWRTDGTYVLWFTEYGSNKIGKLAVNKATWEGYITEYTLPTDFPTGAGRGRPNCIAIDPGPDHLVWFTEDSVPPKIGYLNPDSTPPLFKEYIIPPLPSYAGTPWGIVVDPLGAVWFTDITNHYIVRLNRGTGEMAAYAPPTSSSEPREIIVDSSGNIWFTEYAAKKIGKYVPTLGVFMEYPLPSGGRPHGIAVRKDTSSPIWFTESAENRVGILAQPGGPTTTVTVATLTYASSTTTTVYSTSMTTASASTSSATRTPSTTTFASSSTTATITSMSTLTDTTRTPLALTTLATTTTSTEYLTPGMTTLTSISTTTAVAETKSVTTTLTSTSTIFSPTVTMTSTSSVITAGTLVRTFTFYYWTTTIPTSTNFTTASSTLTSLISSVLYSPTTAIATTTTTTTSTTVTVGPRFLCLIATATYGSELSPIVQFLRNFRDQAVLSSFAGKHFMIAFNEFYYSFSPAIAQVIEANPAMRWIAKVLLYPLIAILQLTAKTHCLLGFNPEFTVIVSGLVASCLIGVGYLAPLVTLLLISRKRLTLRLRQLKPLALLWLLSVALMLFGEMLNSPFTMVVSTAAFVLASLSLSALALATKIFEHFER